MAPPELSILPVGLFETLLLHSELFGTQRQVALAAAAEEGDDDGEALLANPPSVLGSRYRLGVAAISGRARAATCCD